MRKFKVFICLSVISTIFTGCGNINNLSEDISFGEILEIEEISTDIQTKDTGIINSSDETLDYSITEDNSSLAEDIPSTEVTSWCFYYNQLTDNEKQVYKNILAGCENFENEIKVSGISLESLYKVWHAFNFDNPEYFWTSEFTYYTIMDKPVSIEFKVDESFRDTLIQLNSIGDEIIKNIPNNSTDYEKVKFLYEYIINTVDYVNGAPNDQDIRSSLINKQSVCAGYSRAFQFLCKKAGIKCTYVSGIANGELHGWNLISINDNYYWVDVTWGDPVYDDDSSWDKLNYDFLCVDDEMFLSSHTPETGLTLSDEYVSNLFTYPNCTDKSLDYHVMNNSYFEIYNRDVIYDLILNKITNDEKYIELKFKTFEEMQKAYNDIFTEDSFIFDIMGAVNKGWSTYSYYYTYGNQSNTISIEITSK